jgi:hypothetical protein
MSVLFGLVSFILSATLLFRGLSMTPENPAQQIVEELRYVGAATGLFNADQIAVYARM